MLVGTGFLVSTLLCIGKCCPDCNDLGGNVSYLRGRRFLIMVDSIRTENLRIEQAKLQLEHQQERDLKELREKHHNELERMIEGQKLVKDDLEKAYEVNISTTRDDHEKKLSEVRASNSKMIEDEKMKGDEEVEKTRSRYQEQIAHYRENSEKALEDLRRKHDSSAETIKRAHERRNQG